MYVRFGELNYPNRWTMEVDLKELCDSEGKKDVVTDWGSDIERKTVLYPKPRAGKLFTLMIKTIYESDRLDEIQDYLEKNSKTYGEMFSKLRKKYGR